MYRGAVGTALAKLAHSRELFFYLGWYAPNAALFLSGSSASAQICAALRVKDMHYEVIVEHHAKEEEQLRARKSELQAEAQAA